MCVASNGSEELQQQHLTDLTCVAEETLKEYKRRIVDVPGAVTNLYFAYMLMLCAVNDAADRLTNCKYMGTSHLVVPSLESIVNDPALSDPAIQLAASALREHASSESAKVTSMSTQAWLASRPDSCTLESPNPKPCGPKPKILCQSVDVLLQVWKARLRTRDLLGVMNCVQCNRCRLHGKVASLGIGVALQVRILHSKNSTPKPQTLGTCVPTNSK